MEQACELSRSEASITKPAASAPVQDHAETAGQGMDGIEDNLAIGQLHRQEVQLDRHTRITLTPS